MLHQGYNCHYAFVLSKESRGEAYASLNDRLFKNKNVAKVTDIEV